MIAIMSIIKSFSVGNGDMFYIKHNSDNFTIIDCYLKMDNKDQIIEEIKEQSKAKTYQDLFQHIQMKIILAGYIG